MSYDASKETTGLVKINDHCLFTCYEAVPTGERLVGGPLRFIDRGP